MNTPRNGSTREWRRKRARALSGDPVCWLCGDPIDKTLPWPDPMSPSVDHKIPRALGGTDAPHNLGPSHLGCNLRKSDRLPGPDQMPRSRSLRRPPS